MTTETERKCRTCGVTKPLDDYYVKSSGWRMLDCKKCYMEYNYALRLKKRIEEGNPPRQKIDGPCAFRGCMNDAKARLKDGPDGFYCGTHYNQWRDAKRLKPIRNRDSSYVTPLFRKCTYCMAVKPQRDFYVRGNGHSQTQCKVCMGKVTKCNYALRNERYDEAMDIALSMAPAVRQKYIDRVNAAVEGRNPDE